MDKLNSFLKKVVQSTPILVLLISCFTIPSFADTTRFALAFNNLMKEYRIFVTGISAFGTLTCFVVFIVHMIQLSTLGSAHPTTRRKILNNILVAGITTALLGGSTMIFYVLYDTAVH